MHFGSISKVKFPLALVLLLASCRTGPPRAPSIGEAYAGPAELKIRSDIPLESSTVAVVRHGERLDIIGHRRQIFIQVRTSSGAEGWTEARQLLGSDEMAALQDLADRAAAMPVQGVATVYEDLRVHTTPSRVAPSFLTIKEKDRVSVLTHVVAPRTTAVRKRLIPAAPKKKAAAKKPAKPPKYPPPPMPKPPGPPPNWLELSVSGPQTDEPEETQPEEPPKPVPVDDWSLVRTRSGQAGWVLTARLVMAIPDEVAQYAEGAHITSYFSLGDVQDGEQKRHNWLWTTMSGGRQPYDFDSFRVFIWSLRRHRYETAYIERNVKGYQPVLLKQMPYAGAQWQGQGAPAQYPGFSLCLEKADGKRYQRDYVFLTNIVRFAGERPCEAAAPAPIAAGAPATPSALRLPPPKTEEGFATKFRNRVARLKQQIFGR